jgi:hypothetical protein
VFFQKKSFRRDFRRAVRDAQVCQVSFHVNNRDDNKFHKFYGTLFCHSIIKLSSPQIFDV